MLRYEVMIKTYKNARAYLQKAFTVVELIIVITVIGILITVSVVGYGNIQGNTRDKGVMADIDTLDSIETSYGTKNNVPGKAWYSANGVDTSLQFTQTVGNVIDIVINSTDYCIRGYNVKATTYKTIATAAIKESTPGSCTTLTASSTAITDSP